MKIKMKVTTGYKGKKVKKGDTLTVPDDLAKQWIKTEAAEQVKEKVKEQ